MNILKLHRALQPSGLLTLILFLVLGLFSCSDNATSTEAATLSVTVDSVEISALSFVGNASDKMVAVRSNHDFTLTTDQDWCTLSNKSGSPTLTDYQTLWLRVSVEKNATNEPRTATLTIQTGDVTKKIAITQSGLLTADDYGFEVATVALQNMGNGLNIGNTLDAYGDWISGTSPKDFETAWGNPQITPQLIAAYKSAGVKALRLPVTWRQHIDAEGNVSAAWMARVREVVDYIIGEGMYCILNVHHDCGGDEGAWLRADKDENNFAAIERKFKGLWTSIANEFQGYGDHLLFEGYNELLDGNLSWTSTDDGGYAALNQLAQTFVTTVRTTGGNNAHRNLIVNTYSADAHEKSLNAFTLPTDVIDNHLITEVHVYTPGEFVGPETAADVKEWNDSYAAEIDEAFSLIDARFTQRGIPTIIGEFGCNDNVPEAAAAQYAALFTAKTRTLGIPSFYWFDLIDRNHYTWKHPTVLHALLNQQ